jgi:Na+-transporting NADH:ubiquinone oxidoreductase subunit C
MFSNLYIFKFATIMVVGVAAVLSAAAIFLKPYQDANIRIEKMQDILQAADIPATADNAIDLYEDHHLVQELGVNLSGEIKSIYTTEGGMEQGDVRAFDINIKELVKQIDDYKSGKVSTEPLLPVFIIQSSGGEKKYVFPVRGRGLWGPIWGNIALKEDMVTIAGVKFDHQAETPGLGAEINTSRFEKQFVNKRIFNDQGNFVSVELVKGGSEGVHEVDAVSGGTITSDGVTEMLESGLRNYLPFIKSFKVL